MKTPKTSRTQRDAARAELRELLKPGDTVQTILRDVSRSGMFRKISVVIATPADGIKDITWLIWRATAHDDGSSAYRVDPDWRDWMLGVSGAGMDMGFSVVYDLSRTLFDDGYALSQRWL